MNQLDLAIYNTVHDYSGGTEKLAGLIGVSGQVLLNKANPNNELSFLSPHQLMLLQSITGNYSINSAMQAIQSERDIVDIDTKDALLDISVLLGKEVDETRKALEDGVIDSREASRLIAIADSLKSSVEDYISSVNAASKQKLRRVS